MDLDEFSDDGFDDLPDNALQELEKQAIQFTQAHQTQRQISSQQPTHHYAGHGWEEDDDLDTTEVTNDAGVAVGRPVIDKTLRQPTQQPQLQRGQLSLAARPRPPVPNPRWNPTGNLTAVPGSSLAVRPRIPSTRPPGQQFTSSQRFPVQGPARSQSSQFASQPTPSQPQHERVISALQQRVRVLEAEVNSSRGETSILRAQLTKVQQEKIAEVSHLLKINAEQTTKHERVVEAALAAERTANTELQFLQRDMKEVSNRARRKETTIQTTTGATTPKKATKTWGMADGFDDMDIASPNKGQGRSRNAGGSVAVNIGERTPSKGKRKRPVADSPIKPLEIHAGDVDMTEDKPGPQTGSNPIFIAAPAAPFDFLQLVLDHGFARDQAPTFDILSRFSFPSNPMTSFSTLVFERLPLMGNAGKSMQLLVDFAEQIIILWARCYEEQFWDPIKYLASLISFTLQLHTSSVAPLINDKLVPIAQSTMSLVADAPQRPSDGSITVADDYSFLEQHIDTTQIISLLYTTALGCATTPLETEDGLKHTAAKFWRLLSPDIINSFLMPKRKVVDITAMLDLLGTSSLPCSIGPIVEDKDAETVAKAVIERVSAKLIEPTRTITAEQKRKIRLAALKTLIAFARYPFGAQQLASHNTALPRLVICLSASIDDLYDQPIPSSIFPPLPDSIKSSSLRIPESSAPAELNRIISQCVLLIHTLVTDPLTTNSADITRKLSLSHGGSQRYIIALGRLAFAEEDLVMEAGIEGEIVEAAHELLEMAVTPDEGEIVSEAFGA